MQRDDNGAENRTKRKRLNLGPFSHHLLFHDYRALSLFRFGEFLQTPAPQLTPLLSSSLCPLCHFNRRIFTFNADPRGVAATGTRVQSITCFLQSFRRSYWLFWKHMNFIRGHILVEGPTLSDQRLRITELQRRQKTFTQRDVKSSTTEVQGVVCG